MDVTCSFVSVTCSFVGVTYSFVGVTCSFDPITFRFAIPKWWILQHIYSGRRGGGGGGQGLANFRQIYFDFAYFLNNHGKVRKWQKRFFTNTTYQTIWQIQHYYKIQLFAFKHKPQTFSRVCLRFITWHLPFETRRLPFKVYCLKIIITEPVYTCKKRLLTSSSLWYHLKTYTSFYFKKLVCFALKLIKLASKHDSYSSRTFGFRILIAYIFSYLNDFRFNRQTSCYKT